MHFDANISTPSRLSTWELLHHIINHTLHSTTFEHPQHKGTIEIVIDRQTKLYTIHVLNSKNHEWNTIRDQSPDQVIHFIKSLIWQHYYES